MSKNLARRREEKRREEKRREEKRRITGTASPVHPYLLPPPHLPVQFGVA